MYTHIFKLLWPVLIISCAEAEFEDGAEANKSDDNMLYSQEDGNNTSEASPPVMVGGAFLSCVATEQLDCRLDSRDEQNIAVPKSFTAKFLDSEGKELKFRQNSNSAWRWEVLDKEYKGEITAILSYEGLDFVYSAFIRQSVQEYTDSLAIAEESASLNCSPTAVLDSESMYISFSCSTNIQEPILEIYSSDSINDLYSFEMQRADEAGSYLLKLNASDLPSKEFKVRELSSRLEASVSYSAPVSEVVEIASAAEPIFVSETLSLNMGPKGVGEGGLGQDEGWGECANTFGQAAASSMSQMQRSMEFAFEVAITGTLNGVLNNICGIYSSGSEPPKVKIYRLVSGAWQEVANQSITANTSAFNLATISVTPGSYKLLMESGIISYKYSPSDYRYLDDFMFGNIDITLEGY